MNRKIIYCTLVAVLALISVQPIAACTGMSIKAKDGAQVTARTIDWGGNEVNNLYTVVPRGYKQQSFLPGGATNGHHFEAKYGYVGLAMERAEFVVEGLNEAGLEAGLFYFPDYGKYPAYDTQNASRTMADLQLVSYVLSCFATVNEAIEGIRQVEVVSIYPGASTAHWRITDQSGHQVVLEFVDGKAHFYENNVGVITNAPGFEWQLTNLNNYIGVEVGTREPRTLGNQPLKSIGGGSGFLGLPGDFTPPSRFVRAAYLLNTSAPQPNGRQAVLHLFHLLNTFDVPLPCDTPVGEEPGNFPSATQWTVACDLQNGMVYYRTMYNQNIRSIDLKLINFDKVEFISAPLDKSKEQPIETITIVCGA